MELWNLERQIFNYGDKETGFGKIPSGTVTETGNGTISREKEIL
jgi:hypothetical protein